MVNNWNVSRDFYSRSGAGRINVAIIKQLKRAGFFVVSKAEAEAIKEKYIAQGMQLYHDRYCI